MGKALNGTVLAVLTAAFWFASYYYPNTYLERGFTTFFILAFIYLIFSVAEFASLGRIKDAKMKYSVKKAFFIVFIAAALVAVAVIWAVDTQSLLVFMGLLAAGIAIALQDVFKGFMGAIMIFAGGIYRVGDRIEVDGKAGDVLDIGILTTTLLELGQWVGAEQPTGRITTIPNGLVLTSKINNYTKDHNFVWDEITIPITFDSDWRLAFKKVLAMVTKETLATSTRAGKDIGKLEDKYYLPRRPTEPAIYMTPTDNWMVMSVRYTVEVRERRQVKTSLHRKIMRIVEGSGGKIKLASATFEIVGFPEVRVRNEGRENQ